MWDVPCTRHKGKVAIVTGAASGIGRAAAYRLAAEGASVVLADIQSDGTERLAREIASRGGSATAFRANIAVEEDVSRLVDYALNTYKQLDILANVAGVTAKKAVVFDTTLDEFNRVTSINLAGTFLCIKHASKAMKERRYGRIVNVVSIAAFQASSAGNAPYAASKGGILALTRLLVLDLSPYGITVNAVAPGITRTPMTEGGGIERMNKRATMIPLGRVGVPEDVAAAIAFLASDDASFITGHMLTVDGGMTAAVYRPS